MPPNHTRSRAHFFSTLSPVELALVANGLFILLVLFLRPIFPVDETRYLSVAWEMYAHQSYFVPLLNGEPYFHKPVLLFWLVNFVWSIVGVSDTAARLLVGAFALGNVAMMRPLAKLVFPDKPKAYEWAPLVLVSLLVWNFYCTTFMFDMVLCFFVLVQLYFMLRFAREGQGRFVLGAGVAGGLALLTKGPVALVYTVPLALFYPAWREPMRHMTSSRCWYLGIGGMLLLALLCLVAWVIPAVILGGEHYQEQLLWHQTVDRITGTLAHKHPIYWYWLYLPLALVPFTLSSVFWTGKLFTANNRGAVFCLYWFFVALIIMSLVQSKHLHYLLPTMPALALLFAAHIDVWFTVRKLPGLVVAAVLASCFAVMEPYLARFVFNTPLPFSLDQLWGLLPLVWVGIIWRFAKNSEAQAKWGLLAVPVCLLAIVGSGQKVLHDQYDMRQVSALVSQLQKEHKLIAHWGKYYDQFHFYGRLKEKIVEINQYQWLSEHPESMVVYTTKKDDARLGAASIGQFDYRNKVTYVIESGKLYELIAAPVSR